MFPLLLCDTLVGIPKQHDTNSIAYTETPPFPLSLDSYPITPSNIGQLMHQICINRQEAQQIFPNICFANIGHMDQKSRYHKEPPGQAYSLDCKYDNYYSLDIEANDHGN